MVTVLEDGQHGLAGHPASRLATLRSVNDLTAIVVGIGGTSMVSSATFKYNNSHIDKNISTIHGNIMTTPNTFSVMCYNVAGLPAMISSGNPSVYSVNMGKRIGDWDIVNVQEDFNYHAKLYSENKHEHRTPTSGGVPFGSGLNTLSHLPFTSITNLQRVKWNEYSNFDNADCMTPKGFTLVEVQLADGVTIDIYNLHTDAGVTDADQKARASNLQQLSDFMTETSADNAAIVFGDTNTRYTRERDTIREFIGGQKLTDAWVQFVLGGVPPEKGAPIKCDKATMTNDCEVVDKIMYRGAITSS
ncbi:hypothetical protein PI124_g4679 [Phytophthora idaei]|nr:hypothetical protein PI126_g2530 [Phytophthora idaei]KAG3250657.1 hypothetical protein PI124_g4679 [Phytophthora idaei]